MSERRLERLVAMIFAIASLAGLGLLGVYAFGGDTQIQGLLLAIALGGLGFGIVVWAHRLLPAETTVVPRHSLRSEAADAGTGSLEPPPGDSNDAEHAITRRTLLLRALAGAVAALGAGLAIPILSLGPAPAGPGRGTPWRSGSKLVGADGNPVNASAIPVDGILTVFPEGSPGSALGQAVLIRVAPDLLRLSADRASWAPNGYVAYSKICTHAGCPVGLFRTEEHRLLCPCHQSTFDVLDGANPTSGPAARPLPQLPIRLEADGTVTALGDFSEPVGPSTWDVTHRG